MAIRADLGNVDPSKFGGLAFAQPGSYHVEVIHTIEEDPKSGCLIVDFEVLAGDVAGEEGKTHREYYSLKPTAMSRIVELAVTLGMTTKEEVERHKAAGTSPELDFENGAIGRQCCIKIVPETYEGKTRNKINFNCWPLDSKQAKGIPLNKQRLRTNPPPPANSGAGGFDNLF